MVCLASIVSFSYMRSNYRVFYDSCYHAVGSIRLLGVSAKQSTTTHVWQYPRVQELASNVLAIVGLY